MEIFFAAIFDAQTVLEDTLSTTSTKNVVAVVVDTYTV